MTGGPRRRADDHVHPEYWLAEDHHRFEGGIKEELKKLREDMDAIGQRLTLILGGLAILAFLIPLISPFLRAFLNLDTPAGQ